MVTIRGPSRVPLMVAFLYLVIRGVIILREKGILDR